MESGATSGFSLAEGADLARVHPDELWLGYLALGGAATLDEFRREIGARGELPRREHNLIAQALNEWFLDHSIDTFPVAYAPAAPVGNGAGFRSSPEIENSRRVRRLAEQTRARTARTKRESLRLHEATALLLATCGSLTTAREVTAREERHTAV